MTVAERLLDGEPAPEGVVLPSSETLRKAIEEVKR